MGHKFKWGCQPFSGYGSAYFGTTWFHEVKVAVLSVFFTIFTTMDVDDLPVEFIHYIFFVWDAWGSIAKQLGGWPSLKPWLPADRPLEMSSCHTVDLGLQGQAPSRSTSSTGHLFREHLLTVISGNMIQNRYSHQMCHFLVARVKNHWSVLYQLIFLKQTHTISFWLFDVWNPRSKMGLNTQMCQLILFLLWRLMIPTISLG